MTYLFLKLFNMSVSAAWMILAVILLRLLIKKAPRNMICAFWGLVGLRLILPFSIESIFSLIPSVNTVPIEILYAREPAMQSGIPLIDQVVNPLLAGSFPGTPQYSINPIQIVFFIAANVWLLGMIALAIYGIVSFLILRYKLRCSVRLEGNVWICDEIKTPFVLGIIRPRIYLPSTLNETERSFVIAHEKAHLRRLDHLWKPLGFLLLTVYWFQPMVWVGYLLFCRDIEFACDEQVIRQMPLEEKKKYSEVLLSCSAPRRLSAAYPLAFGEVGVKQRIKSVLRYRKPSVWLIGIAGVLCLTLTACFLTDPATQFLSDIDDTGRYAELLKEVDEVELVTAENGNFCCINTDKALLEHVLSALSKVKVSALPASQDRSEGRAKENAVWLRKYEESLTCLFFSKDFHTVWISEDNGTPSLSYTVQNPAVVRQLFEQMGAVFFSSKPIAN